MNSVVALCISSTSSYMKSSSFFHLFLEEVWTHVFIISPKISPSSPACCSQHARYLVARRIALVTHLGESGFVFIIILVLCLDQQMLVLGLVLGWGWVNILIRPRVAQGEEKGGADDEGPHGEGPLATLTIQERSYYHIKYDISLIMVKNGILLSIIFASLHIKLRVYNYDISESNI